MASKLSIVRYENNIPDSIPKIHPERGSVDDILNSHHAFINGQIASSYGVLGSQFCGTHICEGGNPVDSLVPIMVHCVWPVGQSRYALLYVKPSVPPIEFNIKINAALRLPEVDGVAVIAGISWFEGCFNPLEHPHLAARVGMTPGQLSLSTVEQELRMQWEVLWGYYDMRVKPLDETLRCILCHSVQEKAPRMMELMRLPSMATSGVCKVCAARYYQDTPRVSRRKCPGMPDEAPEWIVMDGASGWKPLFDRYIFH